MLCHVFVQAKMEKHTVVLLFCTVDSLTIFVPYTLLHVVHSVY
jgi:hypothetical protein